MNKQHDFESARTARFNARQQSSRYHVENEISPSGMGSSPQVVRSRSGQYGQPGARSGRTAGRASASRQQDPRASRPSINRPARTHREVSRRSGMPVSGQQVESYSRGNYRSGAGRRSMEGNDPRNRGRQTARRSSVDNRAENYGKRDTMDFGRGGRSQSARRYQDRTRYSANGRKSSGGGSIVKKIVAGVAAVAIVAIGFTAFTHFAPVKVTVNGTEVNVKGAKDVAAAFEASGVEVKPGNFVAVDDSVITAGEGNPFTCKLNDEEDVAADTKLSRGDVLEFTDGGNIMEEYDGVDTAIPWEAKVEGTGAIHLFQGKGEDGVSTAMTGKTSGKKATKVTKEPDNVICHQYDADTKGEKVIALTIDDGPWEYTSAVLDVLKENNAKATFFVIGENIEEQAGGVDNIKRMQDEGHQICTHTYDHAEGSGQGVNLTYMSAEEQVQEIQKGYDAITAVTGGTASTVIRCPGGNLDAKTVLNLKDLVTCEVGWDIDTEDWRCPGSDAIYEAYMSSYPGAVILCHDGGGDRSQTVEALKRAVPELIEKGYTFITMDEMLKYDEKAQG